MRKAPTPRLLSILLLSLRNAMRLFKLLLQMMKSLMPAYKPHLKNSTMSPNIMKWLNKQSIKSLIPRLLMNKFFLIIRKTSIKQTCQ